MPFRLEPGQAKTIRLRLAWYVPETDLRSARILPGGEAACTDAACGCGDEARRHQPWYAGRFADIEAVNAYWREHYDALRAETAAFSDCFYDTTLPAEVVEAVAANLTILKSPTVLRQADGRLWAWEGCCDSAGCCPGSCTHVWNYAQALPHLFPDLERTLRETEFGPSAGRARPSGLPLRRAHPPRGARLPRRRRRPARRDHEGVPRVAHQRRHRLAASALAGGAGRAWTTASRPGTRTHAGVLVEPHHNTYDIEFWGPDGMCTSFYLGALQAAACHGPGRRR